MGHRVYNRGVGLKTTAFDAAATLGWDIGELARRSGIPAKTLYALRTGARHPGPKSIAGLLRAFPHLSFERLFVPADSTPVGKSTTNDASLEAVA